MKKKITDDLDLKAKISFGLKENYHKYGAPHCPCVNPKFYNEDTICPCKAFREETPIGEKCYCGLYEKISQD